MNLPASSPTVSLQVSELEVVPNSDAESNSEVEVLNISNVSSNISNICNISKQSLINFNPFYV